jgi:hypothetical protein
MLKAALLVVAWLLWTAIASGQVRDISDLAVLTWSDVAEDLDAEGIWYIRSRASAPEPLIFDIAAHIGLPVYVAGITQGWDGNAILPLPNYQPPEPAKLSDHPTIRAMHTEAIKRRGGRDITLDEGCCQNAQKWANYMARTGNFRHGGGGYRAQIIAAGQRTVQSCFTAWMTSLKGHRGIVLTSRYKLAGWGFQKSASGRCYWVGAFR